MTIVKLIASVIVLISMQKLTRDNNITLNPVKVKIDNYLLCPLLLSLHPLYPKMASNHFGVYW